MSEPRQCYLWAHDMHLRHGISSRMEDDRMELGNRRLGKETIVAVALFHAILSGV